MTDEELAAKRAKLAAKQRERRAAATAARIDASVGIVEFTRMGRPPSGQSRRAKAKAKREAKAAYREKAKAKRAGEAWQRQQDRQERARRFAEAVAIREAGR